MGSVGQVRKPVLRNPALPETVIELRNVNVTYGGTPNPPRRHVDRSGRRTLGRARAERVRQDDPAEPDLRRPPAGVQQRRAVFGRRRGSGESIWDVKRRIGLVSPELHLYFTEPLTAERGRGHRLLRRARPAADDAGTGRSRRRTVRLLRYRRPGRTGRSAGCRPASSGSCC